MKKKKKSKKNKKRKEIIAKYGEKAGEITLDILECIASIPEALVGSFLSRDDVYRQYDRPEFLATKFFDHLRSMRTTGYIEIEKIDGNYSVQLTKKGKIKLLEDSKNTTTDGKWRFLSFDIPEDWRRIRNQFRRSIKRIGYRQVQQSLWACPFIRADEVDLIIDELKIRKYVAYFVIEKTDIENHLSKLFPELKQ